MQQLDNIELDEVYCIADVKLKTIREQNEKYRS